MADFDCQSAKKSGGHDHFDQRLCRVCQLFQGPSLPKSVIMSAKEETKKASDEESSSIVDKLIPRVKAEDEEEEEEEEDEEDLIDPAVEIKEACASSEACQKYKSRLDECNERVTSKSETSETCLEEILDFYHCMVTVRGTKSSQNSNRHLSIPWLRQN